MKRIYFLIGLSVIFGGLGWISITRVSYGSVDSVAGLHPSATVVKTSTPTPFQLQTYTPTTTASPTLTSTPVPSFTPTASRTTTPSATPTSSGTPTATLTPTPQDKAYIEGIEGRWPAFSLDCEARSAVDWAAYFGYQIDEIEFFNRLPVSDNPNLGFVGNVHAPWGQTPPDSYGVHAGPVAELLRSYGLKAQDRYDMSFQALRAEIAAGRPVIVWVVGRVGSGTPIAYTPTEGQQATVARFEHTVIVIGYNRSEVTVLDGYWVYTRLIQDFKRSWAVLGNMAVVWGQ